MNSLTFPVGILINFSSGDMHFSLVTLNLLARCLPCFCSVSLLKVLLYLSSGICRPQIGSHCAKVMWKQMRWRSQQAGFYLKGDRASPWQAGDGDSVLTSSHKLFWFQSETTICLCLLPLSLVIYLSISRGEICICLHKKLVCFPSPPKKG